MVLLQTTFLDNLKNIQPLEFNQSVVNTSPNEITEKFIQRAEKDILSDPASYLWSHDRWKFKKPKEMKL